ncbi:phage integrase SAM-like domain-containing protein [Formosa haliotis]|uniref:phage integrase SAM-like domain-containing protein n=1 Tax=Formosa haliotis TaxID=1555194 RepID=UPI00082506C2|nr:phage integrase SAM-like domain-containing protein [Formosa haliotis]
MSTVTFSYRSDKPKAFLEARLSFRIPGKNLSKSGKEMPFSFYKRSRIEVTKEFWNELKKNTNFKDEEKINLRKEINDHIYDLQKHVLEELDKVNLSDVNKEWFKNTIETFYVKPKEIKIPEKVSEYIDFYLTTREHELTEAHKGRYNVVKNKLLRYNPNLMIKHVNEDFNKLFVSWCNQENYSQNTIHRDLKYVKTIVKHARMKGLEINPEFETINLKKEKAPKIFLSFKELEAIQELADLPNYLNNARDWLLISCYTGQRISDFMRFNKSMLRFESGVPLLEFTQIKTDKNMSIPVLPEVRAILDKRSGEFPTPISDQKYNQYIKDVCKRAEINEMIKGRITKNISEDEHQTIMRKVEGSYPKYKLITSHIGRRSFATNYYGKLPTTFLIGITGHSAEKMFLEYIGKGQKDLAFDAYEYFLKMNQK